MAHWRRIAISSLVVLGACNDTAPRVEIADIDRWDPDAFELGKPRPPLLEWREDDPDYVAVTLNMSDTRMFNTYGWAAGTRAFAKLCDDESDYSLSIDAPSFGTLLSTSVTTSCQNDVCTESEETRILSEDRPTDDRRTPVIFIPVWDGAYHLVETSYEIDEATGVGTGRTEITHEHDPVAEPADVCFKLVASRGFIRYSEIETPEIRIDGNELARVVSTLRR